MSSRGEVFVEIALASDRNYFRGLAVTACSIAKSADRAATLRFHILHIGLTDGLRAGLVAEYRFSGDAVDSSGNGHSGEIRMGIEI